MLTSIVAIIPFLIAGTTGKCYTPSPAFPVPEWSDRATRRLQPVFAEIEDKLEKVISDHKYENVSYSIEVTTGTDTIWQHFHTAARFNESRPGTRHVDSSSQYRIASISKLFTTLALLYQQQEGNLALDSPILNYISELAGPDSGKLPWKDISLRSLASQLSGIPRDSFQCDFINYNDEPWLEGLPPVSRDGLPRCNEYDENYKPCSRSDFLGFMKKLPPVFAPNQLPTYSNNGFVLLGLALQNATGTSYEDYIQRAIFDPLNMTSSTMEIPPDDHAVLPFDGHSWDVDESIANPTGGIYSSSADLSKFLRYILTHYNTLATGVNWLKPLTYTYGMHGFYGLPWEIFRTERILSPEIGGSGRPVTFTTKSGGLRGYLSHVLVLEEYGLGITMLVGSSATDVFPRLLEIVTVGLVRGAEKGVWEEEREAQRYGGTYVFGGEGGLDSSVRIAGGEATGYVVESFVSNGTDALARFALRDTLLAGPDRPPAIRVQIVPTLLFKDEERQRGEIWRAVAVPVERSREAIWDDYCLADIDTMSYAGLPLNEIVFWHEEEEVEMTAFRVKLKKQKEKEKEGGTPFEGLKVQN